jgi:hypothetical protein
VELHYDSQEFPVSCRKAFMAGDSFSFEIRGVSWQLLRQHVVKDQVPNWAALATIPELQSFVVTMALADTLHTPVRVVAHDDFARVFVGTTH